MRFLLAGTDFWRRTTMMVQVGPHVALVVDGVVRQVSDPAMSSPMPLLQRRR